MVIDIGFTVETVKVLSDMTEQQTKHINKLETDARALKDEKAKLEVKKKHVLEYQSECSSRGLLGQAQGSKGKFGSGARPNSCRVKRSTCSCS